MRTVRVALLMVFAASLVSAPTQAGIKDFFNRLDPTAAKYSTFKGTYFDKVLSDTQVPQEQITNADDVNQILEKAPAAAGKQIISGADLARFHTDSLLGNKQLNSYLQGIIAKLLADTPWQNLAWSVDISLARTRTAMTYPDGTVVITLSQLLDIQSEDELAMLLGHEISHIILNHFGTDWFVNNQKRLVAATSVSLSMVEKLAQQMPSGGADTDDVKKKLRLLALVRDISTDLLYPGWQRGQEEEADLLGMDLMIRAGYNPDDVFELYAKNMQAAEMQAAEEKSREEREKALNDQITQLMTTGGSVKNIFKGIGDVLLSAVENLRKDFKRTHPEYDKRLSFLAEYRDREYVNLESPESNSASWQNLRYGHLLKSLLQHYEQAMEAENKVDTGDVAAAAAVIFKLQKGKHRQEPYIQQVSAQVRRKQDHPRKAKYHLEQATKDSRAGYPVYEELAILLGNAGHPQEAVLVLREASKKFPNLPNLRMNLIYWSNQAGDKATAQKLALDCRLTYPDYGDACTEKLNAPILHRTVEDMGPPAKPARKLARKEVQELQTILNQLGYPVGKPDGLPGNKTKQAVSRFQQDSQLPITGQFDQATISKLYKLNPSI